MKKLTENTTPRKTGRERQPDKAAALVKAIRAKCVDCSGGSRCAVAECQLTSCALHRFRMGLNPSKHDQNPCTRT